MSATKEAPGRGGQNLAFLLAALGTIGSFTIDTYLPAMHDIAATFSVSPLKVQQTMTSYLFMFSIMSLWHGAISDALGRRKVILVTLGLYVLSSLGCAFATRIEDLWLLRGLQGFSACASIVVGR
ncbi:MAG: MFS transporter, partial [Candidatus Accumulibacter sp.]|nr:MFS transporter [Accumulibacter sp.]